MLVENCYGYTDILCTHQGVPVHSLEDVSWNRTWVASEFLSGTANILWALVSYYLKVVDWTVESARTTYAYESCILSSHIRLMSIWESRHLAAVYILGNHVAALGVRHQYSSLVSSLVAKTMIHTLQCGILRRLI